LTRGRLNNQEKGARRKTRYASEGGQEGKLKQDTGLRWGVEGVPDRGKRVGGFILKTSRRTKRKEHIGTGKAGSFPLKKHNPSDPSYRKNKKKRGGGGVSPKKIKGWATQKKKGPLLTGDRPGGKKQRKKKMYPGGGKENTQGDISAQRGNDSPECQTRKERSDLSKEVKGRKGASTVCRIRRNGQRAGKKINCEATKGR